MSTFEFPIPIPTSFQSSVISSNLNSVIIFTFLTDYRSGFARERNLNLIQEPYMYPGLCLVCDHSSMYPSYWLQNPHRVPSDLSNGIRHSSARLSHIVKVIIESAAVYSLTILAYAIQAALPITLENLLESPLLVEGYYFETIIVAVAVGHITLTQLNRLNVTVYVSHCVLAWQGMAPTVIAARIVLASEANITVMEQMTSISGLRVQSQSESFITHTTNTA
ncbi:hypothetical protein CVT25_007888 [Psilocybe cyanescens]|uniref:Uncharacterized protein n=1 Tax=Psilocybe cyanescens TaxID=93625 RepID=A0A409XTJ6_PSICY|nr:hypothetical protein CVT25_007888 [Psilocybe cyanescens]